MVCLGNICRSPIAQGIMEHKIEKFRLINWEVDSAGTSGWHQDEHPDDRAIKVCRIHGIDISRQTSRKITVADLDYYNQILVMDANNYNTVLGLCTDENQRSKVKFATEFMYPGGNVAVHDPYYDNRFDEVYEMLDTATDYFLEAYAGEIYIVDNHH